MEKTVPSIIMFLVLCFSTAEMVRAESTKLRRAPSVEPMVEVNIEDVKKGTNKESSYDFAEKKNLEMLNKTRIPANIVTKPGHLAPSSYIGPLIFLITLPIALWIMVFKRFNNKNAARKRTENDSNDDHHAKKNASGDDDNMNFPKAS